MKPANALFLGLALSVSVASCASIVTGDSDTVDVLSIPSGASFETNTGHRGTTPATIEIPDTTLLHVNYSLDGFQPAEATLAKKASPWVLGNIILGGIIGIVIDAASGNMYTHDGEICATLYRVGEEPPALEPVEVAEAQPAKAPGDSTKPWSRYSEDNN